MELQYQSYPDLPPEPWSTALLDLLSSVFSNQSRSGLLNQLTYQQAHSGLQTLLAVAGGQVVGCKLGYERKPGHFYSWLGAVHPNARGQGIASELMRQQHDWCRQHGYHTVRTQTYNQWRSMLLLNLRFGFDIIGTVQGSHGLAIVLEKKVG
ncbi:GNAT family N-acetyltransferase [Spirosoma koreense]